MKASTQNNPTLTIINQTNNANGITDKADLSVAHYLDRTNHVCELSTSGDSASLSHEEIITDSWTLADNYDHSNSPDILLNDYPLTSIHHPTNIIIESQLCTSELSSVDTSTVNPSQDPGYCSGDILVSRNSHDQMNSLNFNDVDCYLNSSPYNNKTENPFVGFETRPRNNNNNNNPSSVLSNEVLPPTTTSTVIVSPSMSTDQNILDVSINVLTQTSDDEENSKSFKLETMNSIQTPIFSPNPSIASVETSVGSFAMCEQMTADQLSEWLNHSHFGNLVEKFQNFTGLCCYCFAKFLRSFEKENNFNDMYLSLICIKYIFILKLKNFILIH